MAVKTGTATGYWDMLAQLRDFAVDDCNWEQVGGQTGALTSDDDYVSLKGPGLSGTDQILVSLQPYSASANNAYSIRVRGHTAYTAPGTTQPGSDSPWRYALMVNAPMTYWFVGNGRHVKAIFKSGSRYDAMYFGLLLPEHLPGDWSYPLYIGASSPDGDVPQSSDGPSHSNFWQPIGATETTGAGNPDSCAFVFSPMQAWVPMRNARAAGATFLYPDTGRATIPWSGYFQQNVRRLLDGEPWFVRGQVAVFARNSGGTASVEVPEGGQMLGSFDGVFYTPSFGASAEQEAVVGGKTYKMFPNIGRTSDSHFAAFLME